MAPLPQGDWLEASALCETGAVSFGYGVSWNMLDQCGQLLLNVLYFGEDLHRETDTVLFELDNGLRLLELMSCRMLLHLETRMFLTQVDDYAILVFI